MALHPYASQRGDKDLLLQVCTEKDLTRIAYQVNQWESLAVYLNVTGPEATVIKENYRGNYEQQKVEVLKKWKSKKGPQATFKALVDVFSNNLGDHGMVGTINRFATLAFQEPSEDWVIENLHDIEQLGVDNLQAAISRYSHMLTDSYTETLAVAANERKKLEVIVAVLSRMVKQELMTFLEDLKANIMPAVGHHEEEHSNASVAVSQSVDALQHTKFSEVGKKFRLTVRNIKKHLENCDVQDLVTDFNISVNDIPYFSDEVKKKLHKCGTVKDLFVRLSPYISWCKRDVLRVLVEVSDCKAAVDELDDFENWLNPSHSIMYYPIPQASSSICPDPNSDITMVAIKANRDLKAVTYKEAEQFRDTMAERGGVTPKAFDLQGKTHSSSILYWLIPRSVIKSFEENIRSNLDYLYDQGILEILLDPNIVITTGRKLRVRSLSYLTKLPPKGAKRPQRAEEIVELVYQLKIDVRKRDEEIKELDDEVKNKDDMVKQLERDKEEKEQECNQLKQQLDETVQENAQLKQQAQVSTQSSSRGDPLLGRQSATFPRVSAPRGLPKFSGEMASPVYSAQHINLLFGMRGHTAVNYKGKVYIGGGLVSESNGAPNIVQVIDLSTRRVFHLPPCPVKHFALVSIDNQVVTVGGKMVRDDQVTNKLYCWREATQQWEEKFPPMTTPRQFHTSVSWRNYLIVCGGRVDNEDSITNSVEILDLQTQQWLGASSLPQEESGKHAVVTDGGELYLLGGYLSNAVHYCELHKLVASTYTVTAEALVWRSLGDTPSNDCAAVLLKGSLFLIGGRINHQISSRLLRYSIATDEWQHIGDLLCGRTASMAVALNYSTVLVIGGTVLHGQHTEWFSNSIEIVTAN